MSNLKDALESGKFGVTAEMAPPKGYDFTEQMEPLSGWTDISITMRRPSTTCT